ncbi:MAG: hypothetical protein A3H41_02340 [Omnitrophica WOR_2 bacterium RIFCSPLOWO2_02_FULL_45_28]|nr:MAG: hypothetical protein A3H41_02340 [Omnitrophica WOR_2 bacterium RIFCSPLOWO2_02_FULL_45_28]
MACYIVTFEVKDPAKLTSLIEGLKSYGSYCPVNASTWAIITSNTAVQIRDHLMSLIDINDRLFVVRSGAEAAWRNAYGQVHTDWLKKYL